ncbi:MAG: hypothetical protein ACI841_002699 [Planctomycetota bacterium]|jgi:hypothetical protein
MKQDDALEPEMPSNLPVTEQAELDSSQIDDLFRDLSACAEIKHITVKSGEADTNAKMVENPDLVHARYLIDQPNTRAIQIRYEFEETLFFDTLTKRDGSYQLIRIQHAS